MNNDLEFLDTYWGLLKEHTKNLCDDIRDFRVRQGKPVDGKGLLKVINFSELGDNWTVVDGSRSLDELARKVEHMVFRIGSAYDVKNMLLHTASGRIKKFYKPTRNYCMMSNKHIIGRESLGEGHFRTGSAILLSEKELEHLNKVLVKHGYTKEANGTD